LLVALSPLLYLGLGFFVVRVFLLRARSSWRGSFFLGFAATYALGLVASYLVFLLFPNLKLSLLASAILALCGWIAFFWRRPYILAPTRGAVLFFVLVALIYGIKMLSHPLLDWDARSIWFFHAKMIYYQGGFSIDWQNPMYRFANLDYPKLVPVIVAQNSYLIGYWNEFLPKVGLLHFLVPLLAALAHLFTRTWSFAIYAVVALLASGSWLWNGYMDGYLALYAGLGFLFFWRWMRGRPGELFPATVFLLLLPQIKKEGVLILGAAVLAWGLQPAHWPILKQKFSRLPARHFGFAAMMLLPFLLWELKKSSLGLTNQLVGGELVFADVWRRIFTESALFNITWAILRSGSVMSLLILITAVFLAGRFRGKSPPPEWRFVLIFSAIFLAIIYAILVVSPLEQHMPLSLRVNMNRVPLTVLQAGFALIFLYLPDILGEEER
jgi:hypothetical protein